MIYIVITFLWASICLYLLLGGADFGAGIIELFSGKKNEQNVKQQMYKAIGPIWEANHMWLIIAIVILFVGFPVIYASVSTYLHIPLAIMLLGIIARGTAFTFRHYDAIKDDWQNIYNKIFRLSSFITPLFLGIIAASTVSGAIDKNAADFLSAYIFSWLNFFSLSVGLFTVAICAYLAAIFVIGETTSALQRNYFTLKAKEAILLVVIAGALVFAAAYFSKIPLFYWIFGDKIGLIAVSLASLSLITLFMNFKKGRPNLLRILAGFQVVMILVAATYSHYPNLILFKDGTYLSLIEHAGGEKTMESLGWALLIGSIFILPFLGYLIYSFKHRKTD
ncbi:MAG: cytochrome d ubiquinol oxidase subunit II [Chitinophagaceae bacterium]|nr:MAG: cytochrome d ubiquinol oxidase subunit II [Chitinophagaceae bacterium]